MKEVKFLTKDQMKSSQIKAELEEAGVTQAAIAESIGYSSAMISSVINRKKSSEKIARFVAESIDMSFFDVFPEYKKNPA